MEELEWVVVDSYDSRRTIINVSMLRTHPMLLHEDCRIFRWISGLDEHPSMKKPEHTLEEQMQNMFLHYHIHNSEWLRLVQYLLLPQYVSTWAKEKIIELCTRIGIYNLHDLTPTYNPMTPKADVRQEYDWMVKNCNSYTQNVGDGWSVAGDVSESLVLFYFRKKK